MRGLQVALIGALLRATASQPSLQQFEALAQENPQDAGAQSNYGAALKASGDLKGAIAQFELAILLNPLYARAYNNMGNANQALGDYAGAVVHHRTAIALEPTLASAYNNLGNAYRELGMTQAAVDVLTHAVQLNPVYAAAYVNLGAAAQSSGDAQGAIAWHTYASRLAPMDPTVRNNLGAALEASGRLHEAAAAFELGLQYQPTSSTLRVNRGNVLRALGRLAEASESYQEAIQLDPNGKDAPTAYNNLAAVLQAAGQTQEAMRMYEAAIALQPADAVARRNLDKLPTSLAYRASAAYEGKVLASRAARVVLALFSGYQPSKRPRGRSFDSAPPRAVSLHRTIRYLRRLECEQIPGAAEALWGSRADEMSRTLMEHATDAAGGDALMYGAGQQQQFTLGAFAWGGVWYYAFAAVFTSPECREALRKAVHARDTKGPGMLVLGSSIGFEAYFAALTYNVPTVGVEILPGLVQVSEAVRDAHDVPSSLMAFACADALSFELARSVTIVYVDDTAWDAPVIAQMANKLAGSRKGTIVIHNSVYESPSFRRVATVEVATSWNRAHVVYVDQVR